MTFTSIEPEIINERKFIDNIHNLELIDTKDSFRVLRVLAKHCYWDLGYKETRTIKALDKFMIEHVSDYNKFFLSSCNSRGISYYEREFKKIYRFATKYPICCEDGFWITKTELKKIEELQNSTLERLAFVLLCYAKLKKLRYPNSTGWVSSKHYRHIFKAGAKINCKLYDRDILLSKLIDTGYLKDRPIPSLEKLDYMSPREAEKMEKQQLDVQVTYIDDNTEKMIFVDDWRELSYYYRRYRGENIIKCLKCGILMRGNKNNTKKYCNNCAGYQKIGEKTVTCIDCGKQFDVSAKDNRSTRCKDCAAIQKRESARMRKQRQRSK